VFALSVIALRFYLDSKKARGSALKPWSLIPESTLYGGMVHLFASARTFFKENPRR
jgi:hypothetical protein